MELGSFLNCRYRYEPLPDLDIDNVRHFGNFSEFQDPEIVRDAHKTLVSCLSHARKLDLVSKLMRASEEKRRILLVDNGKDVMLETVHIRTHQVDWKWRYPKKVELEVLMERDSHPSYLQRLSELFLEAEHYEMNAVPDSDNWIQVILRGQLCASQSLNWWDIATLSTFDIKPAHLFNCTWTPTESSQDDLRIVPWPAILK